MADRCVLLHESESDLRRVIAESLEQQGWQVLQVEGLAQAEQELGTGAQPDVLIVDFDGSAGAIIERYRAAESEDDKVLLTTEERPTDAWRREYRPDAVIYKPFDIRHLLKTVAALAARGQG